MSFTARLLELADPVADAARRPARAVAAPGGGDEAPALPGWRVNLRWFNTLLFVHMGARSFLNFPSSGSTLGELLYATAIVTAAVGLAPAFSRGATRLAFVLVAGQLWLSLPDSANHVYLETVLWGLLTLLDSREESEARLLMQGLRWYVAIFFFYTGVQKVVYGYYFDGQFLAYMAATEERFTTFFQYLIPAEELQRLQSFNDEALADFRFQTTIDAGPYRVAAPLLVWTSNLVWIYELVAGVLLMVSRTRAATALSLILFVILIEGGARELTFGFLMANLALLFMQGPWVRKVFPLFVLLYGYLLLADGGGLGLLPMFWYSPA